MYGCWLLNGFDIEGVFDMIRKIGCTVLACCLGVLTLAGCHTGGSQKGAAGTDPKPIEPIAMRDIVYEKTALDQSGQKGHQLKLTAKAKTGEEVALTVLLTRALEGAVYHIVDWGDGTWSHKGPFQDDARAILTHTYKQAGSYDVRVFTSNLDYEETIGWSSSKTITVEGDAVKSNYITRVEAISSGAAAGCEDSALYDNNNETGWKSLPMGNDPVWVGYEFNDYYRLNTLEVKVPRSAASWPSDLAVEYTTNRGETWHSLPKYYYIYPSYIGSYFPKMKYPNPQGATLVLDLDGIVANGIRFVAKGFAEKDLIKQLEVAELRVTGDTEFFFSTSLGSQFDAELNNMWTIFGSADSEPNVYGPDYGGNNGGYFRTGCAITPVTEWLEWDGLKHIWRTGNEEVMEIYKAALYQVYLGEDGYSDSNGYAWATTVPYTPQHLGKQNHYTYNSTFIIAARNYLLQKNDVEDFFQFRNQKNQVMKDRLELAMEYMLTEMDGATGILTIHDPRNDGTVDGLSSNYWDQLNACGYQSAYENVLFYRSLLAMADIEFQYRDAQQGARYLQLAERAKQEFNRLFWDDETGRYITSVNVEGTRLDFGMTLVNFMACEAGLASEDQAKQIYDWVDGKRIVQGDTSTGADIYALNCAARVNTVAYEARPVEWKGETRYYWWGWGALGPLPCTEGIGSFGNNGQNGGTIIYISYYDLMGRLRYLGGNDAFARFRKILDQFTAEQQLRKVTEPWAAIGEFPESGLVPLTFVTGFMGISQDREGLRIQPKLPDEMKTASVRQYRYNETVYFIEVSQDCTEPSITQEGETYRIDVPAEGTWILTPSNEIVKK